MVTDETRIPPPVNPITKMINLRVLRLAAAWFMGRHLPQYEQVITSDLRSQDENARVGGAENSAHLHGLAEDFKLRFKQGGQALTEPQARALYEEVIAPFWPGFTEFERSSTREGYHIHWNLSREVTTFASIAALAGLGAVGLALMKRKAA